ncbi:MAG: hypothetical protein EOP34_10380 [Rickettsiales bacterium]|nr:MAG: hypothetical protein EOP34_10380 [Rickettsiales bacterium]
MTDGEIDNFEVVNFSKNIANLNKHLYICVVVNKLSLNMEKLNISVIAPLMVAQNVLCLCQDAITRKTHVIASKGLISQKYPNPTTFELSHLQTINIEDLNTITLQTRQIDPKLIVLSETDNYYKCVDYKEILSGMDTSRLFLYKTL